MRSDHWNFLANLLGAPGSAEPPKEEKPTKAPAESAEPEADSAEAVADEAVAGDDDAPSKSAAGEGRPGEVVAEAPKRDTDRPRVRPEADPPAEEPAAGDVLQALVAPTPPPKLPGFGVPEEDPDLESLSGWGSAKPTSGTPRESPTRRRPPRGDADESSDRRRDQRPRDSAPAPGGESSGRDRREGPSQRPAKSAGFASGLGPDFDDDELDLDDEAGLPSTGTAAERHAGRRGDAGSGDGEQRAVRGPRERTRRGGRPDDRGRGGERRDETGDFDDSVSAEERPESDDEAPAGRPRRRRRGERQRMSERLGDEAGRPDDVSEIDDDLVDEDEDLTVARRRTETSRGGAEDEADDAARGRSRRRGRRGRGGRGRGEREEAGDAETAGPRARRPSRDEDDDSADLVSRPGRPERPEGDDDDLPFGESIFDDDHEDDEEVEVIRRGRRRRSRSRRGRDEPADVVDDEVSAGDRPRARQRDSARNREDDNEARGRRGAEAPDADDESARRKGVPTWLETVSILVDANLENRKKGGRGGTSRGRGGRRR